MQPSFITTECQECGHEHVADIIPNTAEFEDEEDDYEDLPDNCYQCGAIITYHPYYDGYREDFHSDG